MDKSLFLPLKKEYFHAFSCGTKTTEYRQYGPRWNEKTCLIGRGIILSCGYGKKNRLAGVITGFRRVPVLKSKGGAAFWLCYGVRAVGPVAEIDISVSAAIKKEVGVSPTTAQANAPFNSARLPAAHCTQQPADRAQE